MFRTASNLEDLDPIQELYSYSTVKAVAERPFLDEQYNDADFFIDLSDDSQIGDIQDMLNKAGGWKAYFDVNGRITGFHCGPFRYWAVFYSFMNNSSSGFGNTTVKVQGGEHFSRSAVLGIVHKQITEKYPHVAMGDIVFTNFIELNNSDYGDYIQ